MKISAYKKIINELVESELKNKEEDISNLEFIDVGTVEFTYKNTNYKIELCISPDIKNPFLTKFIDSNIKICLTIDNVFDIITNRPKSLTHAIIAHEIGHYLAGHLDIEKDEINVLDIDKNILEDALKISQDKYLQVLARNIFTNRAVLRLELEADIIALNFVDKTSLINVHLIDVYEHDNVLCRLEKHNRIYKLMNTTQPKKFITMKYEIKPGIIDMLTKKI